MMYRVMLADDEPIVRKALTTLTNWQELQCEVVYVAANGQELIDHLESEKPDIVVTDIRMPVKDGIEVAKYIMEKELPIKVIILTAYADFSYAQSAVKYNVVDYVTKTGAFDGLIAAVEKAKQALKERSEMLSKTDRTALAENLFKGILDGSVYDSREIAEKLEKLDIHMEQFVVLVLQYRLEADAKRERRDKIYHSLMNFYAMVFGRQLLQGVLVRRNMAAVFLSGLGKEYQEQLRRQCMQITDMMDNFMGLQVYIGISRLWQGTAGSKAAYEEAEYALGKDFLDRRIKINFYQEEPGRSELLCAAAEEKTELLCREIQKGHADEALKIFRQALECQKDCGYTANMIKNSGIQVQNNCRKYLSSYGKTLYEATGLPHSITHQIYECQLAEDYIQLMERIIRHTADGIHQAADRRNSLIRDCESYIAGHYEKCASVAEIARAIGTSSSYLSRIFKEATGRTIIQTLNQRKIEKAKEFLSSGDMKIYEVADALGFENTTYFSHFFKKHTGVSPKDYK